MIKNEIERRILGQMAASYLSVENESHLHNVPPNSETHFKVVIVSEHFVGKRQVARHQAVYGLLSDILAGPVHALALHTYTDKEWEAREQAPVSPDCLGGSGKR